MRLVLFAFPLAIGLGYLLGGRLRNLAELRFRHGWAGLVGVGLQILPVGGTGGSLILIASFVLLLFVAGANWRLPGFGLIVLGLCMNFLVIAVNEGMPVTAQALVASGQAGTLDDLQSAGGAKHHLATSEDHLLFLADRIAIPPPVRQAVSVGDVVAYAGAMWFVVAGMRRREADSPTDLLAAGGLHLMDVNEAAPEPQPAATWLQNGYQLLVIVPTITYLAVSLPAQRAALQDGDVLLFILAVAVVDLIPVPGWGNLQLSLSFPLLLGVAIIFPPPVATLIAFVGSVDPREFRLKVSLIRALFNRSQMALSILGGSLLFDLIAEPTSVWYAVLFGIVLAATGAYVINAWLVARLGSLASGLSIRQVLMRMHGTAPYEFLLSYIGLGLFGAVIAQFYLSDGFWSVIVFLGPLVFARQMYFRSRALADRLAEQNEILADQASRLEALLEKEHHTVDELRELNRMKGEFVAIVSHELRTPVTALMGYAKTLRQPEFADDPKMRDEFLERMERQSDRLVRLVENLLTASNLENNQLPVSVGRVLFEDLVREIIEGLATEASRVHVNVPDDLPVLTTDRQVLSRVLQNLVDNALKYSPDGSPCELEARLEGDHIVFWVRDYGIGISPGGAAQDLRPLLPGRLVQHANVPRGGPRPLARAGSPPAPRRNDRGRQRPRGGQPLHRDAPRSAPASDDGGRARRQAAERPRRQELTGARRSGSGLRGSPALQVLDVPERLARVRARERVLAGRVALHREEVEAAGVAEHVQLLGEVGALAPGARATPLARRDVEPAARALREAFPSRHGRRLHLLGTPACRRPRGPDGPPRPPQAVLIRARTPQLD